MAIPLGGMHVQRRTETHTGIPVKCNFLKKFCGGLKWKCSSVTFTMHQKQQQRIQWQRLSNEKTCSDFTDTDGMNGDGNKICGSGVISVPVQHPAGVHPIIPLSTQHALTQQVFRCLFYMPVFDWQCRPRLMLKTNKYSASYNKVLP